MIKKLGDVTLREIQVMCNSMKSCTDCIFPCNHIKTDHPSNWNVDVFVNTSVNMDVKNKLGLPSTENQATPEFVCDCGDRRNYVRWFIQ